jgi:hypothetical protein
LRQWGCHTKEESQAQKGKIMSTQPQATGRERWPLLEGVNWIEMLSYLGTSPLAERQITDEIEWVITGVEDNTFNGVVRAQLSEARVDQVIDEVTSRFRERNVPHLWFLNEDSRPAALSQFLLAHGWQRLREGAGMAIDLSSIASPFPPPPDLTIERVMDEEGVGLWGTFHRYLENDQRDEPRERLYLSLGLAGDQPLRHYVTRLGLRFASAGSPDVPSAEALAAGSGFCVWLVSLHRPHISQGFLWLLFREKHTDDERKDVLWFRMVQPSLSNPSKRRICSGCNS